jgi:Icc-related predicted phosphoesterase
MGRDVRKLLAVGGITGAVEPLEQLLDELNEKPVDAVAVVGDLGAPWSTPDTYRAIFKALGRVETPAYWVPGPMDAPLRDYLRESYNMEIVYPHLHGVHGTVALAPGPVLFAGMGGEIVDDPEAIRGEEAVLRYPGWEVEYRLKIIREFKEHPMVCLFTTRPVHKGLREPGSEAIAELIKTYSPRLAIVSGEGVTEERLAKTLVVSPGRIDRGQYALIDLHDLKVEVGTLAAQASV